MGIKHFPKNTDEYNLFPWLRIHGIRIPNEKEIIGKHFKIRDTKITPVQYNDGKCATSWYNEIRNRIWLFWHTEAINIEAIRSWIYPDFMTNHAEYLTFLSVATLSHFNNHNVDRYDDLFPVYFKRPAQIVTEKLGWIYPKRPSQEDYNMARRYNVFVGQTLEEATEEWEMNMRQLTNMFMDKYAEDYEKVMYGQLAELNDSPWKFIEESWVNPCYSRV